MANGNNGFQFTPELQALLKQALAQGLQRAALRGPRLNPDALIPRYGQPSLEQILAAQVIGQLLGQQTTGGVSAGPRGPVARTETSSPSERLLAGRGSQQDVALGQRGEAMLGRPGAFTPGALGGGEVRRGALIQTGQEPTAAQAGALAGDAEQRLFQLGLGILENFSRERGLDIEQGRLDVARGAQTATEKADQARLKVDTYTRVFGDLMTGVNNGSLVPATPAAIPMMAATMTADLLQMQIGAGGAAPGMSVGTPAAVIGAGARQEAQAPQGVEFLQSMGINPDAITDPTLRARAGLFADAISKINPDDEQARPIRDDYGTQLFETLRKAGVLPAEVKEKSAFVEFIKKLFGRGEAAPEAEGAGIQRIRELMTELGKTEGSIVLTDLSPEELQALQADLERRLSEAAGERGAAVGRIGPRGAVIHRPEAETEAQRRQRRQ